MYSCGKYSIHYNNDFDYWSKKTTNDRYWKLQKMTNLDKLSQKKNVLWEMSKVRMDNGENEWYYNDFFSCFGKFSM